MDNIGHLTSAYQMGKDGIIALKWAGLNEKRAVWQGGNYWA